MTVMEDVQEVLNYVKENQSEYGLVLLDYLQTITTSKLNPKLNPIEVSKQMGFYLKEFGTSVTVPIVVFVQLKDAKDQPNFADRVQNDRTICTHAVAAIEIRPNFEQKTTVFKFHKNRFGEYQKFKVETRFVRGRYEPPLVETRAEPA